VWLIGVMVCLLAAPCVQLSVSADDGWPHNALRHHWLMPISCHFRDCKALLVTSLTHVSGAITSVQTFTFTFYLELFRIPGPVPCILGSSFHAQHLPRKQCASILHRLAVTASKMTILKMSPQQCNIFGIIADSPEWGGGLPPRAIGLHV